MIFSVIAGVFIWHTTVARLLQPILTRMFSFRFVSSPQIDPYAFTEDDSHPEQAAGGGPRLSESSSSDSDSSSDSSSSSSSSDSSDSETG